MVEILSLFLVQVIFVSWLNNILYVEGSRSFLGLLSWGSVWNPIHYQHLFLPHGVQDKKMVNAMAIVNTWDKTASNNSALWTNGVSRLCTLIWGLYVISLRFRGFKTRDSYSSNFKSYWTCSKWIQFSSGIQNRSQLALSKFWLFSQSKKP